MITDTRWCRGLVSAALLLPALAGIGGSPGLAVAAHLPQPRSLGLSAGAPARPARPAAAPAPAAAPESERLASEVAPGALVISTPFTASSPFVLPTLQLSPDGTYLSSSATFPPAASPAAQQIVVTTTLPAAVGWTLTVAATNLTDGAGATIASSGLGLTDGRLLNPPPGPGTWSSPITFTNLPAHNPSPEDGDSNTGLTALPQTFAATPSGDGTAVISATLTLLAPTSTPPGAYGGTIVISVT